MEDNGKKWASKFGYNDPINETIQTSALGQLLAERGIDLDHIERCERLRKGFVIEDVLELGPDEALDLGDYNDFAYRNLRAQAGILMFAAYAKENGLINTETEQAMVYNMGENSAYGHLYSAAKALLYGNEEITSEQVGELHGACEQFYEKHCKSAALDSQSVLCKMMRTAPKGLGQGL